MGNRGFATTWFKKLEKLIYNHLKIIKTQPYYNWGSYSSKVYANNRYFLLRAGALV